MREHRDGFNEFQEIATVGQWMPESTVTAYLLAAWETQYGLPPASLEGDLALLGGLFRSHVTGVRLRASAKSLSKIDMARPPMPEEFFIPVDENRGFVTPEGRMFLEQQAAGDRANALQGQASPNNTVRLAAYYAEDLHAWMRGALNAGPVPLASIGFALFLLINGSVGHERALRLPQTTSDEQHIAPVIMAVVSDFLIGLGEKPLALKEQRQLRTSWVLGEANRKLGMYLSRGKVDKRESSDESLAAIWVDAGKEDALLDRLVEILHQRNTFGVGEIERAIDHALDAFRDGRSLLDFWRLTHERGLQTARLRKAFIEKFVVLGTTNER